MCHVLVDLAFAAVWIGMALLGTALDRNKKKRRRQAPAADPPPPSARPRGGANRPRVVIRPRPAPAPAPPAPAPPRAPDSGSLARYGVAEDSPALEGRSVAEILRALEERRERARTAAERARAEAEAAERDREAARAAASRAAPRDALAPLLAGPPGESRAAALRRAVLLREIFGRRVV